MITLEYELVRLEQFVERLEFDMSKAALRHDFFQYGKLADLLAQGRKYVSMVRVRLVTKGNKR